jgi:hypothetical protein
VERGNSAGLANKPQSAVYGESNQGRPPLLYGKDRLVPKLVTNFAQLISLLSNVASRSTVSLHPGDVLLKLLAKFDEFAIGGVLKRLWELFREVSGCAYSTAEDPKGSARILEIVLVAQEAANAKGQFIYRAIRRSDGDESPRGVVDDGGDDPLSDGLGLARPGRPPNEPPLR